MKACPKKNKEKLAQTKMVEVKATKEEEPKEEGDDKAKILSVKAQRGHGARRC